MNAPNILGIGTCLGTTGSFCTNNESSAISLITDLMKCSLRGITSFNLGTQLKLMEEFMIAILRRNGFGFVATALYGACSVVDGVVGTFGNIVGGIAGGILGIFPGGHYVDSIIKEVTGLVDCSGLKMNDSIICDDVIILNIPTILDVGKCVDMTFETCEKGHALNVGILKGLFDALGCMFSSVEHRISAAVLRAVECVAAKSMEQSLGNSSFLFKSVLKMILSNLGCPK